MTPTNLPASRELPSIRQALAVWATAGLGVLGASAVVGIAAAASARSSGSEPEAVLFDPLWLAGGTLANELAVAVVLGLWLKKLKLSFREMLRPRRARGLVVLGAALVVFGLAPAADAVGELTRRALDTELTASLIVTNAVRRASTPVIVLLLLALAIAPGVIEEALFRGFLTPIFARRSALAAVLVPSLLFGLFHLEPTQVAGTAVLGIGFGVVRVLTGSLGLCMATHAAYNAAVILALSQTPDMPAHEIDPTAVGVGLLAAVGGAMLLARTGAGQPKPAGNSEAKD